MTYTSYIFKCTNNIVDLFQYVNLMWEIIL